MDKLSIELLLLLGMIYATALGITRPCSYFHPFYCRYSFCQSRNEGRSLIWDYLVANFKNCTQLKQFHSLPPLPIRSDLFVLFLCVLSTLLIIVFTQPFNTLNLKASFSYYCNVTSLSDLRKYKICEKVMALSMRLRQIWILQIYGNNNNL